MENIRNIIESLLFVSDEPLTVDKLKTVLETEDAKEIRASLNALADQYEARGGGFRLCEVAGGWQLRSRSEYNEYIKRMLQPSPQRLSRAALETLAIVAYNQPIIRSDIEHIRGVDSGGMLRQLLERKLIRVLGRKEIPGRPLIYATSKLFLELFELKNLKDLPTPKEIEEIGTPAGNGTVMSKTNPNSVITGEPSTSTPEAEPGPTSFNQFEQDTAPSPGPTTIFAYGEIARRMAAVPKANTRSGSTFAAASKISTDPDKITTAPYGISTTPFKIPATNGAQNRSTSQATCDATVKNNETRNTALPRADNPKKP